MDSLSQKLVEGIEQLADNALTNSKLPKTIECNIIKVEDAAIGLYTVAYMGNEFEVYSASPSITYEENDIVLVLVPEGDISKTKYILGAASPAGSMYATSEDETEIKIVRDGVLLPFANVSLCSYTPSSPDYTCINDDDYITIIKAYLNSGSRKFVFNAKVQTKLPGEQQVRGNYGLLFKIPIILPSSNGVVAEDEHTWVTARMDVTTMLGDVYNFIDQAPQTIDFEIPENATYDDSERPTLVAFVDDNFIQRAGQPNDIFFTDINIKSVDYVPLDENNGNYLALVASEGNYFLSNTIGLSNTKTITPYLKINGKSKKIDNSYECYWYVEDSGVKNSNSEDYETHGGPGWRCLNQKSVVKTGDEGPEGFQWITNIYTLEIDKDDVETSLRYKCVLVQGSFIISQKIVIENLQATYEIELATVNGATSFVKDLGEVHFLARIRNTNPLAEDGKIRLSWNRADKNGNPIVETQLESPQPVDNADGIFHSVVINNVTWNQAEYYYPVKNIDEYNTFYCTFYEDKIEEENDNDKTKTRLIGTQYIGINTSEDNFEYKIYVQNDRYVYKYDADGDSPMVANYDGPSSSVVKEISPISFIIKDKNNNELTDIDYNYCVVTWMIPKNSMIILPSGTIISREDNDYYYIIHQGKNGSDLYYSIRTQYDVSKNNNTILLNIEFKQYSLNESINLSFLKDGESGTNGTKFTAVITHDDKAYAEPYLFEGKVFKDKFMPVLMCTAGGYGGGYGGGYSSSGYGGEFGTIERLGVYQPRKEENNEIKYNRIKLWTANVKQQITSGIRDYLGLPYYVELENSAADPIISEWNSHPNADITLIQYESISTPDEDEAPNDCKFWILVGQYNRISSTVIQIKSGSTLYRISTKGYSSDHNKILDINIDNYYYSYTPNSGDAIITYDEDSYFSFFNHYLYESELVSRNNHGSINPQFEVKIYKDGELFTDVSKYTVEWSMMDPKTCNPVFNMQVDGNAGILTPNANLYDIVIGEEDDTCNIITAKITIQTDAAEQVYAQTLYAYYPVDLYLLGINDVFNEETEYNLPDVDDGYWEVLYASDGTNPKFNSTPFNINSHNSRVADLTPYFRHDEYGYYDEDGIIGEVKDVEVYPWAGGLTEIGAYWQGQHSSLFSQLSVPSTDDTKLNAKPANKYENGIVKDYISCKTAYYSTALRDKAYDIYWEQQVVDGELYDYSVILYYLPLFQHQLDNGQNFSYNNYKDLLKNSSDFLADRSLLLSYVNNLLQYLSYIEEFIDGKNHVDITPDVTNSKSFLEDDVKDILLKLGDPDYFYDLNDVPNYLYDQDVTQFTFESFDAYKAEYGLGSALILQNKIDACNELLTTYFNNINNIFINLNASFEDFCDFREKLYYYIHDNTVLDNLAPEPTPYNTDFIENCKDFIVYKNYLNTLFNELSTEEYQDYNIIKTNVLERFKSMHDEFDNRYNIKYQSISDNLQTLYNSLQQEYDDYEAALRYNFAFYYHPIRCAYNAYGFSDINSWDGQKLYIDPNGERFLFAPKVGSGYKELDGTHTGICMGIETINNQDPADSKIGLFGYNHGGQTMFLNARSGSAIFGPSGSGQLIIDPTQNAAMLYSSNYWAHYWAEGDPSYDPKNWGLPHDYEDTNKTYCGMLIDLTNSYIHFGDGQNGANGKLYSGHHVALTDTHDGFYLDKTGLSIGSQFRVSANGSMAIGLGATDLSDNHHWQIGVNTSSESFIAYNTNDSCIVNDQNHNITSLPFARDDQVYLGTDGIRLGTTFAVNKYGYILANNIHTNFGEIAGWKIGADTLSNSLRDDINITFGCHMTDSKITDLINIWTGTTVNKRKMYVCSANNTVGSVTEFVVYFIWDSNTVTRNGTNVTVEASTSEYAYISGYQRKNCIGPNSPAQHPSTHVITNVVDFKEYGTYDEYKNTIDNKYLLKSTNGNLILNGMDSSIIGTYSNSKFKLDTNGLSLTSIGTDGNGSSNIDDTIKFEFNSNGNLTVRNIQAYNITAHSGSFTGNIYANDGYFYGTIRAKEGYLGYKQDSQGSDVWAWLINEDGLRSVKSIGTRPSTDPDYERYSVITPDAISSQYGYFDNISTRAVHQEGTNGPAYFGNTEVDNLKIINDNPLTLLDYGYYDSTSNYHPYWTDLVNYLKYHQLTDYEHNIHTFDRLGLGAITDRLDAIEPRVANRAKAQEYPVYSGQHASGTIIGYVGLSTAD